MGLVIEQFGLGDRRLRLFARAPWELFRGDPHWTPPLTGELLGRRTLGLTGLLTATHPYHRQADVTHFIARDGRRMLGRVSAAVNHRFNEYTSHRIGFFGFFDTVNDRRIADALLSEARDWVQARGMSVLRGPGGYSNATHEPYQGVLIDGFDDPPTVELTHNPPYYARLLEWFGLSKAKDYHAFRIRLNAPSPRMNRLAESARRRRSIEIRIIDPSHLRAEVNRIVHIYNDAWSANWGFVPMIEEEAEAMAKSLRLVLDPGLIRFATVNGELAAVLGALPDPYVPLRPRWNRVRDSDWIRAVRLLRMRRRIPVMRLMFFGVRAPFRNMGLDAILYQQVQSYA
ncbi:MAG TPA: N-acetyltransferase, partial [Candidatus Hydrogenedentes bacterium]|nr:N-acetyltransferase [Candidatus Hydrogenedentota bacterium]